MTNAIRIILGVAVLIGAYLAKQKASPAIEEGEDTAATVSLWGQEMAPSSLNLILAAFVIAGLVMIVLGVVGALKRGSRD